MAEKRMFAKTIIDSDPFLDLPLSAQCLYFHLAMRADDEGFINSPKRIEKMIGSSDEDLDALVEKHFILCFDSGVVVIKHWKIHNYIPIDRFKPTLYEEEKSLLSVKENKAYTLIKAEDLQQGKPQNEEMYTDCIQNVSNLYTQNRLDKNSKDIDINTPPFLRPIEELFLRFWKAYPKKVGKADALKAFKKIKPDEALTDKMVEVVELMKKTDQWTRDGGRFIPYPSTWLNQGRWEDDIESFNYRTTAEGRDIKADRFANIDF